MKSLISFALTVSGLVLALATSSAQAQSDIVRTKDGQSYAGKIKSEEYTGITIEPAKKKPVTLQWKMVDSITYGGVPALENVEKSLSSGNNEEAIANLKVLEADKKKGPIVRQRVLFLLASTLYRVGKVDEANPIADTLRSEFASGHYVVDIARAGVDALLAKKDAAGAQAMVEKITRDGKAANLPNGFDVEMKLLGAVVSVAAGKLDTALSTYRSIATGADVDSALVAEAELGAADCQKATGKLDEAEGAYKKIVRVDTPPRVRLKAWNSLGEILLERGRSKKNQDTLLDAAFAFMRGVIVYAPAAEESGAEYARAMKGAADAFKLLSDLESDPDVKALYKQRAAEREADAKRFTK